MSYRRAIWVDDETVTNCARCRVEFSYKVFKHHCRNCGLIYCSNCSKNRLIIPQEALVPRPPSWAKKNLPGIPVDEDDFRCPQKVCDMCFLLLKDIQPELRLLVSR
jgi:hypothetical protein